MSRLVPVTAWPHIDPGKKRHQISIFAQSTTRDASGQESPSLGTVPAITCYAAIETFTAREVFQGGFVSQVVHKVYIDWPGIRISDDMKLVVHPSAGSAASIYEIQTIENVQQRDLVMILTCLEIDNATVGS